MGLLFAGLLVLQKTQCVTWKDVTEALRLIKKKSKENASQIPSAIMKTIIKDYLPTASVADEVTLPVGYKFIGNCAISVGLHDGPDPIVSSYPLYITCIKHNRLTNIEYVTLAWIADGVQRSVTVERKIIANISLRRNHSFQSVLQLIELAIFLDNIEMLRDNFKKKLAEKPKVSGGFRSVVGTAGWQKLKETAAV